MAAAPDQPADAAKILRSLPPTIFAASARVSSAGRDAARVPAQPARIAPTALPTADDIPSRRLSA
jgi:hypothetical protein